MMQKRLFFFFLFALCISSAFSQLLVARDTITVIENSRVLKMPWGGGLNYVNISTIDLDGDGKKDVVAYDKSNIYATGPFRCFINTGNPGEIKYRYAPEYNSSFPPVSNWAVLVDYNCDGKEDLFCSTSAGIMVYRNVSPAPVPGSPASLVFSLAKSLLYSYYTPGLPQTYYNLYSSSIGVPGIADIDGDGDLDIITFSAGGVFAEFHRNIGATCDSLTFERADVCWGKFSESNCTVSFNQCGIRPSPPDSLTGRTYHAGACLACLDSDGDGDQDLILGDISCNTIQYIHNSGSIGAPLMSDSTRLYPNFPAKNNTTTVKLNNFPCAYYVDVNNDGKKDLIATPNAYGSENAQSIWYYQNSSSTSTVNFQFVKNNFLQDEMIEVGQNSFPIVFDYDGDGKKDLLVGNSGYYMNNFLKSQLTLYKNISSNFSQPTYSLITRDYAGLSAQNLNNAVPTAGDIDGDGDIDLCIGVSSGQIHWLENTAGSGYPCNFSVFKNNPFSFTTPSAAASPQLFDIDNDGKPDLLIGMLNGRIAYYKNNSTTPGSPSFTLISSFFGGVDVKGDPNLYAIDGCASPYFFRDGGVTKLLVGSVSGNIFYYSVPLNLNSPFTLISNFTNSYNEGGQSSLCFEDINADNKRDLIVGNSSGGLSLFTSNAPDVGLNELSVEKINSLISVFPNPVGNQVTVGLGQMEVEKADIRLYTLLGEEVVYSPLLSNRTTINLLALSPGIYFAKITLVKDQKTYGVTKKLIKE